MKPHRRQFLAAMAASAALSAIPVRLAAQGPTAAPRVARIDPVTDDYYGTTLTDPYRWMESGTDPDWRPWLEAQDAVTRTRLAAAPGRAAMGTRVSALTGEFTATSSLVPLADGSIVYEQRPAGSQTFALYQRGPDGSVRTIIDPGAMREGDSHVSLDWWDLSHDERYIVYGLSPAGSEASVLHIMDRTSGTILSDRIPMTDFGAINWLPDGSGFFYHLLNGERDTPTLYLDSEQRLHLLGADPASDKLILKRDMFADVPITEGQFPIVASVADTPYTIVAVVDQNPEQALWVTRTADLAAGTPSFIRIASTDDAIFDFAISGDTLWLVSEKNTPRRKLLSTPLSAPDLANATLVVPASEAVIETVYPIRDGALLKHLDGGVHRLTRIDVSGSHVIALPFDGDAGISYASKKSDAVWVNLDSWLNPPVMLRCTADGSVSDSGLTPPPPIDVTPFVAERRFATARDGTRIPYTLMAKRGWATTGHNPTLATAYGAYGSSATPGFNPRLIAFLEAGGIFVDAGVRGGGDYGREWHEAGKKATKPNSWRDLIDVCEALIAERVTSPAHLVGWGVSAGGIAIGRAMTERPDMFAGAIAEVGFMNPLRYVSDTNIADILEWGPMEDEASFRVLYTMDSYRAVVDRPAAPAIWPKVMVTMGINDPRVGAFHPAKFAAALQAAGADTMLRVDFDAGHGIGSTRAQTDALRADQYAWVLSVAG